MLRMLRRLQRRRMLRGIGNKQSYIKPSLSRGQFFSYFTTSAMTQYEIGKPYPHGLPSREGFMILVREGGTFDLMAKMSQLRANEKDEFRKGSFQWGVYVEDAIPIVVIEFFNTKISFDAPFNIYKLFSTERERWLDGQGNAVTIFLADERHILHSIRLVGAEPAMMQVLRDAAREQLTRYASSAEVERAQQAIMARSHTAAMLKNTQLYTVIR
jgi:hypothetical protein